MPGREGTVGPVRFLASYDLTVVRDSVLRDNVFFVPGDASQFQRRVRAYSRS